MTTNLNLRKYNIIHTFYLVQIKVLDFLSTVGTRIRKKILTFQVQYRKCFNSFKRTTNFNKRKQLICCCFQHNVGGQARQEKPQTISRTKPEKTQTSAKRKNRSYAFTFILQLQRGSRVNFLYDVAFTNLYNANDARKAQ